MRVGILIVLIVALFAQEEPDSTPEPIPNPDPTPAPEPNPQPDDPSPVPSSNCSVNSCDPGDLQICDSERSICVKQLTQLSNRFTITENTSYIYYQPQFEAFSAMVLVFCGQPIPGVKNILRAIIQKETDELPNESNSRAVSFPTESTCVEYREDNIYFGLDSNNKTIKKLILSLTLSQPGTEVMAIDIAGRGLTHSFIGTFFISSIAVLSFALLLTVVWYFKRRCYARKPRQAENSIDHMNKEMPAKKLRQWTTDIVNCSVCLADIGIEQEARKTPCDHYFHPQCLNDWCKKVLNCPNCRLDFSKESLKKFKKERSPSKEQEMTVTTSPTSRRWWSRDLRTTLVEEATAP